MRTNDLFRDLLDGRIPMPVKPKGGVWIAPAGTPLNVSDMTGWINISSMVVFTGFNEFVRGYLNEPVAAEPASPRTNALHAKQSRGTGPTPEPLRTRGRNNHYRTKG